MPVGSLTEARSGATRLQEGVSGQWESGGRQRGGKTGHEEGSLEGSSVQTEMAAEDVHILFPLHCLKVLHWLLESAQVIELVQIQVHP